MTSGRTREEHVVWEVHRKQLEDTLAPIEHHTMAVLRALKCSTNPIEILAVLEGKVPRPWPLKTAERDRERARHAMHVLLAITDIRAAIGPLRQDAPKAAFAGFRVGYFAYAINAAFGAKERLKKRVRGRKGGQTKARKAQTHDKAILKHAAAWRDSEYEIVDKEGTPYASAAAYASAKTGRPIRTIQVRLKELGFQR